MAMEKNELVAGTHWFKYTEENDNQWEMHKFATDYVTTKVVISDVDGDGKEKWNVHVWFNNL